MNRAEKRHGDVAKNPGRYQCPQCGDPEPVLVYRCNLNGDGDIERLRSQLAGDGDVAAQDAECPECGYESGANAFDTRGE